jgi:steroid delta-isomerase-like uncharacterized protein
MSDENTHIIARRFIEAFAKGDTAALTRLVAENLVDHNLPPGQKQGRQGLLEAVAMYRTAFPDMTISIENMVASDGQVAVTGKITGTNLGSLMGAPATGKKVTFAYMDMYRIQNGHITETWHVEDVAGMLQQLGPTPDTK